MRIFEQSIVQVALTSLALLPGLISAQAPVVDKTPRCYFTPVAYNDAIYVMGGSNTTLDVRFMNLTNGLDINKVNWTYWSAPKDPILRAYGRGVAYPGPNGEIFVQGGQGTTDAVEKLVKFHPQVGTWEQAVAIGAAPPVTSMMSASYNSSSGIAYYYGGWPLKDHEPDGSKKPISTFSAFNTKAGLWNTITPITVNVTRPGRWLHTSTLVNNQLFIMGGQTYGANSTTANVEADFHSVLVYDIESNVAMSVTTMGDIPTARQSYSTALGLDGKSIVIYGGYIFDGTANFNPVPSDVYVLDTCTLTWSKKTAGGSAPEPTLFAHGAITINNYMVVTLGKTDPSTFNDNTYILDMNQWKWVSSFTNTDNTIASATCQFALPGITAETKFAPFNYDYGVVVNPLANSSSDVHKKGFGIGFGLFALILVALGVYFYMRRMRRKKARTLNPRWMRNVPSQTNSGAGLSNDRDYPLFVYNKELDNDNTNNPNRPVNNSNTAFAPNGVRTYTASDHEQWEHQLNQEPGLSSNRHSDIWQRMRGLNDSPVTNNEEQQQTEHNRTGKLLDV